MRRLKFSQTNLTHKSHIVLCYIEN